MPVTLVAYLVTSGSVWWVNFSRLTSAHHCRWWSHDLLLKLRYKQRMRDARLAPKAGGSSNAPIIVIAWAEPLTVKHHAHVHVCCSLVAVFVGRKCSRTSRFSIMTHLRQSQVRDGAKTCLIYVNVLAVWVSAVIYVRSPIASGAGRHWGHPNSLGNSN